MPVITLFNGDFCGSETIVNRLLSQTHYKHLTDDDVVGTAAKLSGLHPDKVKKAFSAKPSLFNKFTHEKEHSIAWLRLAMAKTLEDDNLLFSGFSGQLIPRQISHALRICLIADMKSRVGTIIKDQRISEKEAFNTLHKLDEDRAMWIHTLFKSTDPWDASLYDIVLPTDKLDVDEIIKLIEDNIRSEVIKPTESSQKAARDFILAAQVEVELIKEGHTIEVSSRDGAVTLTINKHVLMLSRLEEELKLIASKVPGVNSIETRVGKGYHKADIYRRYDFEAPSRVLIVDDEREFVQTLSERLLMRDMGSVVAFDGESAIDMVREDEPDVMILDLKMPGIDGIQVLKSVKNSNPDVEVIILTGHGSEADKEECMKLGAFAYLQKPVNIDILSETLKKANQKTATKKANRRVQQ